MTEEKAIEYIRWLKTPILPAPTNPIKEALEIAISAIERMIPKKVSYVKVFENLDYLQAVCPACGSSEIFDEEYEIKWDCCPSCGQRLLWEDEK